MRRFIDKADVQTKNEIERLIAGECIEKEISLELTYDELDKSIENLWSVLYLTGYLTKVRESELKAFPGENRTALSSPGT